MITKFKIFENKEEYKIGDYIIITSVELEVKNKPVVITYRTDIKDFNGTLCWGVDFLFDSGACEVFENEIVRKMEPHEVAAIKYNL